MPSFQDYQAVQDTILLYTSAVKSLMYVITITQSDIAFILSIISCYSNNCQSTQIAAVTRILQYIKCTLHVSIIFYKSGKMNAEFNLIGYTDANYGSAKNKQKSTSR